MGMHCFDGRIINCKLADRDWLFARKLIAKYYKCKQLI